MIYLFAYYVVALNDITLKNTILSLHSTFQINKTIFYLTMIVVVLLISGKKHSGQLIGDEVG